MTRGTAVWHGVVAGLAGGAVFGAAMARLGALPTIAALVRVDSAAVGFVVNMSIAAVVGAIFGLLVRHERAGGGEMLFWGLAYGAFWWYLGPLTLWPILLGEPVGWSAAAARSAFPSLLGLLLYGATTGLVVAALRGTDPQRPHHSPGALVCGGVAGLAAAWLLTAILGAPNRPLAISAAMTRQPAMVEAVAVLCLGLAVGVGYTLLFPDLPSTTGPALVRGAGYGFLVWVSVGLTIVPLVESAQLPWSATQVRHAFPTLPTYLLLGATTAALTTWLRRAGRLLFAAPAQRAAEEGLGARTLRAVGRGAAAGAVGGLIFTVVMVQIGFLGTVARLVGSTTPAVGIAVHLAISMFIGACYGLLFRRQTHDLASGLGWGSAYGFLWWILGALTILPIWLGGQPQWTAQAAAAAFPSLIGHLAYGASLGVTFHLLESRYDPWWIPHTAGYAARAARRRAELTSSAPAVWILVVLMAVTVTVLLGGA